jgi:hypothetical protein
MSETPNQSGDEPEGEILKANTMGPDQVHVGMDVTSIDGERIGKVKELRANDFLIDRPMARDLWAPFSAILAAEERGGSFRRGPQPPDEVVLSVSAAHIDAQGWPHA